MICENCNGSGKSQNGDGETITCFFCDGHGNMCDACGESCEEGTCDYQEEDEE